MDKDINKIVKEMKKCDKVKSSGPNGYRYLYGEKIKKIVIDYMVSEDISAVETARRITEAGRNIEHSSISGWRRKSGQEITGFVYGATVRYDVSTKCRAVKDYLVNKYSVTDILIKYGMSNSTFWKWKKKFEHNFEEYVNMPEGVPYIVKEEKIVRGKNKIHDMITLLNKQKLEVLELAHEKTKTIDKELEILKQAERIIKSQQK